MEHRTWPHWKLVRGIIPPLLALLLVVLAPPNAGFVVPIGFGIFVLLLIYVSMWKRWGFSEMVGWNLLLLPVVERIVWAR